MPDKLDFIVKSFKRTHKKKYENYVITGIWHRLRSANILLKPVTQQLVRRPDGKHALLDLYFPAINVAIECDENQHFDSAGNYVSEDKLREMDVLKVLGALPTTPDLFRVKAVTSLEEIDQQLEEIMDKIKSKVNALNDCTKGWDDMNAVDYMRTHSELTVADPVVFKLQYEVLNALGLRTSSGDEYAGYMKGALKINESEYIWFANMTREKGDSRFYNVWNDQDETIFEYEMENKKCDWEELVKKETYRYTFCKIKDSLGNSGLKFFGKFKLSSDIMQDENGVRYIIWKKVADTVRKFS